MKATSSEEWLAKIKAILEGPQRKLFLKIVESFFEELEQEYFTPADLLDIEEGLEDLRQGRCLTLEEYRQGKRL